MCWDGRQRRITLDILLAVCRKLAAIKIMQFAMEVVCSFLNDRINGNKEGQRANQIW